MADITAEIIFGDKHVLCKAYQEKVMSNASDLYVYGILCNQLGLDPDELPRQPDELEQALIKFHQHQGELFKETEELLTVITEGKMQVVHTKLVVSCDTLGSILLDDSIQLIVNGMMKAQTFDIGSKEYIVHAFMDSFPDRTLRDLESLSYYDRIETVMQAYHSLHPRDGINAVIAACQRACPDTSFTMEVQRPEFIGEAYVAYLLDKWQEKKEAQYIMGLANFIGSGRYLSYGKENAALNLFNQQSHQTAYDIFHTAMVYNADRANGEKAPQRTPRRPGRKGAGKQPGTGRGGGNGKRGNPQGDDADDAVTA